MKYLINLLFFVMVLVLISGCSDSNESSKDELFPPNEKPVVSLPEWAIATGGEQFSITAEVTDPDSSTFTYSWAQLSGTQVSLINSDTRSLTFNAPVVDELQSLTFELTATDRDGESGTGVIEVFLTRANTGTIIGKTVDAASGSGIPNVSVSVGDNETFSDAAGEFVLFDLDYNQRTIVNALHPEFGSQSRIVAVSEQENEVKLTVAMIESVQMDFNAGDGVVIDVPDSNSRVELAANSLVNANGDVATGVLTVKVTSIDPSQNVYVMPGDFSISGMLPIETFGGLEIEVFDSNGNTLELAPAETASIRISENSLNSSPLNSAALYSYSSQTGFWSPVGNATLVGSYYQATVDTLATFSVGDEYDRLLINGCVNDLLGNPVNNITVRTEGFSYSGTVTRFTSEQGLFSIYAKDNSSITLFASRDGTSSNTQALTTNTTDIDLTECLTIGEGAIRVKLSWGAEPLDLDSHLVGPDYHVYYGNTGSLINFPFVQLDVDDTDSFGPEVITITSFESEGEYAYSVHNFSGTFNPGITASPTVIELNLDGDITLFRPPSGEGNNITWNVFTFIVDESGRITVRTDNTWSSSSP